MKKLCLLLAIIIILTSALVGCSKKANPVSDFEYLISEKENIAAIKGYIGDDLDVIVPQEIEGYPVTLIYISAFAFSEIESITLPDTVQTIQDRAFMSCSNLHTVNLGKSVTVIGAEAFKNCKKLENIKLPYGLQNIGTYAFFECKSLKEITIPKSVTEMGMGTFYSSSLSSITFEEGIETIGSYACFWCGDKLKSITIPKSVKEIGEYSFNDKLEKVYFKGDAPEKLGNKKPFGDNAILYYKKNKSGWDTTPLKDEYTLIPY
ncbi:MAG: leucine-rich repeat domain-containing protein [Clostridia bacterium]|nr:leucine-rich repeat domain-containing protein [Clostridia bacterium]